MRLNESIIVSAPPKLVWDYLADPGNYLHFMSGVTRWEVVGRAAQRARRPLPDADPGRLGRGRRPDRDRRVQRPARHGLVIGDRRRPARPLAAARGRGGRTRVELRFAYGVAGAGITGCSPSASRRRRLRATCAARCTSSSARSSTSSCAMRPPSAGPSARRRPRRPRRWPRTRRPLRLAVRGESSGDSGLTSRAVEHLA